MKVAAVCDFPYWEGRIGSAVRMESLCQSLAQVCDLSVICSLTISSQYQAGMEAAPYTLYDRKALKNANELDPGPPIAGVRPNRQVTVNGVKRLVEAGGYDAVLIPYFNRSWMIEHIRPDILRIVDTIDCQSQRARSFAAHGLTPTFPMTAQEEGVAIDRFDVALAISDEDQNEFSAFTDTPVITAPFRLAPKPIYAARENASEVLFIAAQSDVNNMTLAYLMEEILPLVRRPLTLHVVGNVTIPDSCPDHITLVRHENVSDVGWIYRSVDLALNPTYAGGGIKTKTLEAMAYGVPVLTSDEGARGLSDLLPGELVINDKETFAYRIGTLLDDQDGRRRLSEQIIANMQAEDNTSWTSTLALVLRALKARQKEKEQA
ncbi:hypothetical protein AQS8620_02841 [Aquimixticola soesokkakensis]|uniref:Glycosyl transferases group 1 n=1 Tax=Aquimixticola soesokkakensis TaxID=1519096 RepID=A0A1Y5TKK8_9RHOB|nr:glycosyltransferase [Aquimixticola soesokkakensis]SLN62594.1 hypothetical protein AQS8620_02841 [Aquimixticola soesokkakensis]